MLRPAEWGGGGVGGVSMQQEDDTRARRLSGGREAGLFEISCAGESFYPATSQLVQFAQKPKRRFRHVDKRVLQNDEAAATNVIAFVIFETF